MDTNNSKCFNKKLLMIVPKDLYHDTEFSDPVSELIKRNIAVTICSTILGTIHGVNGNTIDSILLVKDVIVSNFDAICIMGGKGTGLYLWDDLDVRNLIHAFNKENKLVTAICSGSVVLARSGILASKKATTFPVKGFIDQLENAGALYSEENVIVDGNIITANGPIGAKEFGLVIADELSAKS